MESIENLPGTTAIVTEDKAVNSNVILAQDSSIDQGKNQELKTTEKTANSNVIPYLDEVAKYLAVDLQRHLPDSHFDNSGNPDQFDQGWLKRFALQTAEQCQLPQGTTLLNLLGIYSSVACRAWTIQYINGSILPIGLYAICEQPSGTGKSRCQKIAQEPFFNINQTLTAKAKSELKSLEKKKEKTEKDYDQITRLEQQLKAFSSAFISNATAEGLEKSLFASFGYFSAVASEQGLFNSLLGPSYKAGQANNNDIVLNGFDGGYVTSCRVTREGYSGFVIGSIVLFAQQGSVEKVLEASNGTGLAERFLMLVEPHSLGKRNHFRQIKVDETLEQEYARRCEFARNCYSNPVNKDKLGTLKLTNSGYDMIAEYRQKLEPHLADGEKFSHIALRGAASKIDIQILKISAVLYLLLHDNREKGFGAPPLSPVIEDSIVKAAIGIADDLLENNLALCRAKGLIGAKAEVTAILRMFEKGKDSCTERQIIESRLRVEPFKSYTGNKSDLVRVTLAEMVEKKILAKVKTVVGGKTTVHYQMAA